ncbi:hypothetical protein ZHAS_00008830 [Anopheles sinensis]|uniref:Uncharacterized protein n=1 Tax=Anopheles sinensis TaxID=74873 RepID=A0A084VTD0_ANOSI|nr:hypothetical protein ZHAS_00008830 [Anopheles sinensis]
MCPVPNHRPCTPLFRTCRDLVHGDVDAYSKRHPASSGCEQECVIQQTHHKVVLLAKKRSERGRVCEICFGATFMTPQAPRGWVWERLTQGA